MKIIAKCKLKIAKCKTASGCICSTERFTLFTILLFVNFLFVPIVRAEESQPPRIVSIRVGFADRYKVGLWTPVEVALQGGSEAISGKVSLIVPDGDGVPSRVSTPPDEPCRLEPGGVTKVRLLCRFGRVKSTLKAELSIGGNIVAQRTFETASKVDDDHFLPGLEFQRLIVVVGDSTLGAEEIGKQAGTDVAFRPVAARIEDLSGLPTHWSGYEGVDAVILSTSKPEIYDKLASNDPRIRALDEWIRMGGRLVLCVGSQAEKFLAPQSPLSRFAPGRLAKMVSLRELGGLEGFCASRSSIPRADRMKTPLRVPRLTEVQGITEAHEADLPLVIRTAKGFGQIIFVAADLDRPPLDTWIDRSMLAAALLDISGGGEESEETTAMMHFGYSDLSGQLRSALDRFDGVQIAPFWLVAGLILAYLLLIGPCDYFFLRKVVGRMRWTWLTFSLVIVLTCSGAYLLAYRLKGDALKVNQANVVDVDAASKLIRGSAWMNVFSPRMESFDLAMMPTPAVGQVGNLSYDTSHARSWTAWLGLPGTALGGMNPPTGDTAMWTQPYSFSPDLDAMLGVPIPVWASKSFCSRWMAHTNVLPEADLTDENQLLVGTVVNTFEFPLEQCILAYGASVYELGTIGPGEAARLGAMAKRSELKTLLTGRRVVFAQGTDKYQQETTPYDQSSADIPSILRMMMFYQAAGGRRYTGLWNSYQSFIDMSALLKADRAILVGQAPAERQERSQAATLLRDGRPLVGKENRQTTIYRIVFPVKKEKSGE
jgi:hypothetical protein